jgi:hypothetical protein
MKKQTCLALSAALLLAGVSAASAAAIQASGAKMAPPPRDTLNLTSMQQKAAWKDLYMKSLSQARPSGFRVAVGAVLPKGIATGQVTAKAAGDVPALKAYRFAMLERKLLIVNPKDQKIAEVITP